VLAQVIFNRGIYLIKSSGEKARCVTEGLGSFVPLPTHLLFLALRYLKGNDKCEFLHGRELLSFKNFFFHITSLVYEQEGSTVSVQKKGYSLNKSAGILTSVMLK
jgi:hypothetical protein